jgi:hypothetical protein
MIDRRGIAAGRWLDAAMIGFALAGAMLILLALRASEWTGDEVTYTQAAQALGDALAGR